MGLGGRAGVSLLTENKMKVITAKIGPDDHVRGINAVSQAMRDAGMEVVYMGTGQRIEGVLAAALEEDADVIGLGFHYGGQVATTRRLMAGLRERGLDHVSVIVGGVIPPNIAEKLLALGVAAVYPPGSSLETMVAFVRGAAAARRREGRGGGESRTHDQGLMRD
jgi:methylmalonyl-CoA mutase C-terminal domain/subunit